MSSCILLQLLNCGRILLREPLHVLTNNGALRRPLLQSFDVCALLDLTLLLFGGDVTKRLRRLLALPFGVCPGADGLLASLCHLLHLRHALLLLLSLGCPLSRLGLRPLLALRSAALHTSDLTNTL
jgi:hypothetical protein